MFYFELFGQSKTVKLFNQIATRKGLTDHKILGEIYEKKCIIVIF